MRHIQRSIGALVVALAGGAAQAGDFDEPESFNAPSGNISCHYTPRGELPSQTAGLHCVRFEPGPVRVSLGEKGPAGIERGIRDACCGGKPALAYGATWSAGPFRCVSRETGMTCEAGNGHGFFVSRANLRAY